jgi:hypothetical protein
MSDENYEKILQKVVKASGLPQDEIERRVQAKQAKLSGLISKDGALQVISAELGISFDNEKFKIDELVPSIRKVNVVGKVVKIFPVRSFTTKKGDEGKVLNLVLADDTSNIKVVLWDTNHISLFEKGVLAEGHSVEILNGSMRTGEIHLGSFSELKPSKETFSNVITQRIAKEKNICDFNLGETPKTRAFVVQAFAPKFFHVCPDCKKKATPDGTNFTCLEHGKVSAEKRAILNLILDDGTETIRAVFFHENITKLGLKEVDNPEIFAQQKELLLGKELIFSGNVRKNDYFNSHELIIDDVVEVGLDELIVKLGDNK